MFTVCPITSVCCAPESSLIRRGNRARGDGFRCGGARCPHLEPDLKPLGGPVVAIPATNAAARPDPMPPANRMLTSSGGFCPGAAQSSRARRFADQMSKLPRLPMWPPIPSLRRQTAATRPSGHRSASLEPDSVDNTWSLVLRCAWPFSWGPPAARIAKGGGFSFMSCR